MMESRHRGTRECGATGDEKVEGCLEVRVCNDTTIAALSDEASVRMLDVAERDGRNFAYAIDARGRKMPSDTLAIAQAQAAGVGGQVRGG